MDCFAQLGIKMRQKCLENQLSKRRFNLANDYTNKADYVIIPRHPLYGDERSSLAPNVFNIMRNDYEHSQKSNSLMAQQTIQTGLWCGKMH